MSEFNCAFNAKFQDSISEYEALSFDLCIADPPYFSGPEKRKYYGKAVATNGVKRPDYGITTTWEIPTGEDFLSLERVSKNQIIWGANYFSRHVEPHKTPRRAGLQEWLDAHPVGWIVWDKCNGVSSFNDFELAWTSFDRPTQVFRFMWNGMQQGLNFRSGHVMQGNKSLNEKRIHPTQKPVALYEWLFTEYADPGQKILDPYLGSGSIRIAAEKFGVNLIAYESDKKRFDDQQDRFFKWFVTEKSKLKLFAL
jgi:site-specific DNA-methyltransferase (adenine-specific)